MIQKKRGTVTTPQPSKNTVQSQRRAFKAQGMVAKPRGAPVRRYDLHTDTKLASTDRVHCHMVNCVHCVRRNTPQQSTESTTSGTSLPAVEPTGSETSAKPAAKNACVYAGRAAVKPAATIETEANADVESTARAAEEIKAAEDADAVLKDPQPQRLIS